MTQIFHNDQPSHRGDRTIFEVVTSTLPKGTLGSVASLLAATLYQGNPDRNHKLWNIVSTVRYKLHMQVPHTCAQKIVLQKIIKNHTTCVTKIATNILSETPHWFVTRLKRRVSLVEQEVHNLPEHVSSPPVFSGVRVTRSFVLYACLWDRCLFFCPFFFWPLCCLFFFDIRNMITLLVSSNSSYYNNHHIHY